jgi:hypothetical protein
MAVTLGDQIAQNIQQKTTEELLAIWVRNDRRQWSDAAFDGISQTLSERGVIVPPQEVFMPALPVIDQRYKGVRGWLLFFCINLTVLTPLGIMGEYGAAGMDIESIRGISIDGLISLAFAGFSIYVGVCLWRVRPGAVKKAKVFLWCIVALNAIVALLTFMAGLKLSANGTMIHETLIKFVAGAITVLVWLAYLDSSKRVKATYGL